MAKWSTLRTHDRRSSRMAANGDSSTVGGDRETHAEKDDSSVQIFGRERYSQVSRTLKQFLENNIYTSVKNGPNTGYVCATCLCAFAYRRGHVQGEWVRGAQMRGGGRGATPLTAPQFAVCGVYVLPVCDMYCCLQWCFSPNKLAT